MDPVIVGHSAEVLDLHSDFAEPDFQQISPLAAGCAEDYFGIREDLEFASVRNPEDSPPISACDHQLLRLHQIACMESPRGGIPHYGDLPGETEQFGGSADVPGLRCLGAQISAHQRSG
jgi:hypothetical protein